MSIKTICQAFLKKRAKKDLVLYDSSQNKYLAQSKLDLEQAVLTENVEEAYRFKEKEIIQAWRIAYKAAWLGLGRFYVHGI